MARVTFLGLNMDVATQVQIVAAIRGLYPDLVAPTDSDNRAVQLVLKHIIAAHVVEWARRSAVNGTPDDIGKSARDQAVATMNAAATTVSTAVNGDILPTAAT